MVLILSTSEGSKAESNLEPPSGFKHGTPGWESSTLTFRPLNMHLDYLSCFAVVLRKTHGKVDICQVDYDIHSKSRPFPYSEVTHGSTTGTSS